MSTRTQVDGLAPWDSRESACPRIRGTVAPSRRALTNTVAPRTRLVTPVRFSSSWGARSSEDRFTCVATPALRKRRAGVFRQPKDRLSTQRRVALAQNHITRQLALTSSPDS